MDAPPALPSVSPARVPPRFRWLKRLLLAAIVYFGVIFGLRWWVIARENSALATHLAERAAAGERVSLEDFQTPPVPDSENGAVNFRLAAAAMNGLPAAPHCPRCTHFSLWALAQDSELQRTSPDCIAARIAIYAPLLREIEAGLAKPRIDWLGEIRAPLVPGAAGLWTNAVDALLVVAAMASHVAGDDQAAIERLEQLLSLSDRIATPPTSLDNFWIANNSVRLAARGLSEFVGDLRIAPEMGGGSAGSVSRAELEALRDHLLDERTIREHTRRALEFERLTAVALIERYQRQGGAAAVGAPGAWTVREALVEFITLPNFAGDALSSIRGASAELQATSGPYHDWQAVPRHALDPAYSGDVANLLRNQAWARSHACEQMFANLAHRRLAATLLAIRLYELDTQELPPALDALAPHYLPSVPQDPYRIESPIRYCRNGDCAFVFCALTALGEHTPCERVTESLRDGQNTFFVYQRASPP